jgi:hypothetical protein
MLVVHVEILVVFVQLAQHIFEFVDFDLNFFDSDFDLARVGQEVLVLVFGYCVFVFHEF